MKKTFKILSQTALITLLSVLWILILPQLITSVYADPVTVSNWDDLIAAFAGASTDSDNPTVIVLENDIDSTVGSLSVDAGEYVVLNLNGHTITEGNSWGVSGNLKINGPGNLVFMSSHIFVANGGECTFAGGGTLSSATDTALTVEGKFTLVDGTITSTATDESPAVCISNGQFILNGGTVTSQNKIAVYLMSDSNSEFSMSGGSLYAGGFSAVEVGDNNSFHMTGGRIDVDNKIAVTVGQGSTFVMSGGTVENNDDIHQTVVTFGNITITGGTIRNTGAGAALTVSGTATQNGGTIIGRIDTVGTGTFDYQSGVNDDHPATPSGSGKDDNDEHDDDHEDAPATSPAPKPLNPNAILVSSFTGVGIFGGNVKIGPQVQGPAAQLAFKNSIPAGWKEAFTFNMTVKDKADYTLKKGTLSFRIPTQYLNAGRKFAILGLDKNGKVKVFNDTDLKADTITVNLDIEGYAFDLIYSD